MKPRLWLGLLVIALVGCQAAPKNVAPPFVPDVTQETKIKVDKRLLEPCPPLPENVVIEEFEDIINAKAVEAKLGGECRRRHRELSDIIRNYIGSEKP